MDRSKYELVSSQNSLRVIQIRGSVNFFTIGLVKMLISVEIGNPRGERRQSWKERSIVPSKLVKVKLDEEDGKSGHETKFNDLCSAYRNRFSTSEEDEVKTEDKLFSSSLMSRSYVLDLSNVTLLDRAGCAIIDWCSKELSLSGLVIPLHLEVRRLFFPLSNAA